MAFGMAILEQRLRISECIWSAALEHRAHQGSLRDGVHKDIDFDGAALPRNISSIKATILLFCNILFSRSPQRL